MGEWPRVQLLMLAHLPACDDTRNCWLGLEKHHNEHSARECSRQTTSRAGLNDLIKIAKKAMLDTWDLPSQIRGGTTSFQNFKVSLGILL